MGRPRNKKSLQLPQQSLHLWSKVWLRPRTSVFINVRAAEDEGKADFMVLESPRVTL